MGDETLSSNLISAKSGILLQGRLCTYWKYGKVHIENKRGQIILITPLVVKFQIQFNLPI